MKAGMSADSPATSHRHDPEIKFQLFENVRSAQERLS
jgi:hypothetical protein